MTNTSKLLYRASSTVKKSSIPIALSRKGYIVYTAQVSSSPPLYGGHLIPLHITLVKWNGAPLEVPLVVGMTSRVSFTQTKDERWWLNLADIITWYSLVQDVGQEVLPGIISCDPRLEVKHTEQGTLYPWRPDKSLSRVEYSTPAIRLRDWNPGLTCRVCGSLWRLK